VRAVIFRQLEVIDAKAAGVGVRSNQGMTWCQQIN